MGKAADDLQWRKSRRRLSQTQRPELHSVESGLLSLRPEGESRLLCMGIVTQIEDLDNSSTSTPWDIVNQCSRGFAFRAGFLLFSDLQPPGLQRGGKASFPRCQMVASGYFRKFPVFSGLKLSYLKFLLTTGKRQSKNIPDYHTFYHIVLLNYLLESG